MSIIVRLLIFSLIFVTKVSCEDEGEPCVRDYDDAQGICRKSTECRRVREDYNLNIPITLCAYIHSQPIVCCPTSGDESSLSQSTGFTNNNPNNNHNNNFNTNDNERISIKKCEEYSNLVKKRYTVNSLSLGSIGHEITALQCDYTQALIFGGVVTKVGEYPHMAVLIWRNPQDSSLIFGCGGSLISERFVLTAAHCLTSHYGKPIAVRLGDQNVKTRDDGVIEVDYRIEKLISHPKYRSRQSFYNDIGLIKLLQEVTFSKTVRPACLWQSFDLNTTHVIASGWGYTEDNVASDELMKVSLNVIDQNTCERVTPKDPKLPQRIIDSQICAGDLTGGRDTCRGDSGGPIQVTTSSNPCLFHIVGVTSFGSSFCGAANTAAVYTRVASYIDWIESEVWS